MRSSFIASVVFAANLLMVPSSMAFQIRGAPKKGTRKGPVPHGEIFGYVRDERGFPVVRATVYFGSRGAVVRAYGAETDSKGRYRMEIVPGDWDIRAEILAVCQKHGALHHVFHRRAAAFQNPADVRQHQASLVADIAQLDLIGGRVHRHLPRPKNENGRAHRRRI